MKSHPRTRVKGWVLKEDQLKDHVWGTSTSKNTKWVLDAQWEFPQIQGRVYTDQRENLENFTTCCCWLECAVISAAEGESIAGGREIKEMVPVQFKPSKGESGTRISCESLAPLFGFSVVIRGPRNVRSHTCY